MSRWSKQMRRERRFALSPGRPSSRWATSTGVIPLPAPGSPGTRTTLGAEGIGSGKSPESSAPTPNLAADRPSRRRPGSPRGEWRPRLRLDPPPRQWDAPILGDAQAALLLGLPQKLAGRLGQRLAQARQGPDPDRAVPAGSGYLPAIRGDAKAALLLGLPQKLAGRLGQRLAQARQVPDPDRAVPAGSGY